MDLKRIILPIVLLLVGLNAADAVMHDTNDPNLVGYWKLDETSGTIAVDSKGGDNNGTIVKTNSTVDWGAGGIFGTGITFGFSEPNADGRIVVPLNGMRKEAGTVAFWAKIAPDQGPAALTFRYFMGWQGYMSPSFKTGRVQIFLYPTYLEPEAGTNSLSVGLGDWNRLDSHIKELTVNEWYHIALTWQATSPDGCNGNYKLYVDGIDMPSGVMHTGFTPGTYKNMLVMADYGDIGNHRKVSPGPEDLGFIGTIDEVGFYNAAISREKICALAGADPNKAWNPLPDNGEVNQPVSGLNISWSAGAGATSHDVYFGTVSPGVFQRNQPGTTFDPGTLNNSTTYYWRINEKNAGGTTTGDVWRFTTIPAPLTLLTPNGGEVLTTGTTYDVNWASTGSISSVKIEYSSNNGGAWNAVNTVPNTGSYAWLVPTVNSNQCLVRVSDANNPSISDTSDAVFTINTINNSVRLVPSEYPTIQAAINASANGDMVIVANGTYNSAYISGVVHGNKAITVRSENGPANCVINGGGEWGFWFYRTGTTLCRLEGFTLTNCQYDFGAIYCSEGSSPTITNCIVINNGDPHGRESYRGIAGIRCDSGSNPTISNCIIANNYGCAGYACIGAGILCDYNCNPTINNCIIAGNTAGNKGGGIYCNHNSKAKVTNCILWSNTPNEICLENGSSASITYSDVQGGWAGIDNINTDPLFVNSTGGNLHLQVDSPCINTGNPNFITEPNETDIDGELRVMLGRVDMGADEFNPFEIDFIVVNKRRIGRTIFEYECDVTLRNISRFAVRNVQLEIVKASKNMVIIEPNATFGDIEIGPEESAGSINMCSFQVDRSEAIEPTEIIWKSTCETVDGVPGVQDTASGVCFLKLQNMASDITGDGVVDFNDLAKLDSQWLQAPGIPSADIAPPPDGDGIVDFKDFAELANHWLE